MEQKQLFHFDLLSPEVSMLNNEKAHLRALGSAGCGLWCVVMGYINVCYLTESPRHISCTVQQPSPGSPVWPHQPTAQPMSGAVQCGVLVYGTDNTLRIGTSALAGQTTALYLYLLPSLHNSAMLENDIIYCLFDLIFFGDEGITISLP